jgi:hypothetical protein
MVMGEHLHSIPATFIGRMRHGLCRPGNHTDSGQLILTEQMARLRNFAPTHLFCDNSAGQF